MEELGPNLEDLMQENICNGAKNISPSAAVLRGPVLAADQPHPRPADAGPGAAAARAGARVQGRQARELPDRRPGGRGGQHGVHGGLRAGGPLPRHRGPPRGLLQRGADPGHRQVRGAVYDIQWVTVRLMIYRYMSVNSHMGRTLSRRDDLESLAYMLVYLARGSLPWQTLAPTSHKNKDKYRRIKTSKLRYSPEHLCQVQRHL